MYEFFSESICVADAGGWPLLLPCTADKTEPLLTHYI